MTTHPAWIEIDKDQLQRNIAAIRAFVGKSFFCLPVKANGYGHGLELVGRAASEAGVDRLAVAHVQEGVALRNVGITTPIIVLGAIHEEQIGEALQAQLELSISSRFKADLVRKVCSEGQICKVHLEIDVGMRRTGVRPESAPRLFDYLNQTPCFEVVGIYSHLAKASWAGDPDTDQHIRLFRALLEKPPFTQAHFIRHLANSGGVVHYPHSHLDMVRPGLLTFGYPSHAEGGPAVKPCFSLKARIAYFKVVEAGVGIGYDHTYVTAKRTRIVTIPLGYGDGYRRILSNRGCVLIRGKRCPIVGSICMDQFMVDIGMSEARVGEEVVLIGKQGSEEITVQEVAKWCDTIPYEVLSSFNERLPRIYSPKKLQSRA